MTKYVFETPALYVESDDCGQSQIGELTSQDQDLFVRVQSWDERGNHPEMALLRNRRVRITVEVVE